VLNKVYSTMWKELILHRSVVNMIWNFDYLLLLCLHSLPQFIYLHINLQLFLLKIKQPTQVITWKTIHITLCSERLHQKCG
jgi:hypothetical protein